MSEPTPDEAIEMLNQIGDKLGGSVAAKVILDFADGRTERLKTEIIQGLVNQYSDTANVPLVAQLQSRAVSLDMAGAEAYNAINSTLQTMLACDHVSMLRHPQIVDGLHQALNGLKRVLTP